MLRFRLFDRLGQWLSPVNEGGAAARLGMESLESRLLLSAGLGHFDPEDADDFIGPRRKGHAFGRSEEISDFGGSAPHGFESIEALLAAEPWERARFARYVDTPRGAPLVGFARGSGALAVFGFEQPDFVEIHFGQNGAIQPSGADGPLPVVDLSTGLPCNQADCSSLINTSTLTVLLGGGDDEIRFIGNSLLISIEVAVFGEAGNDHVSVALSHSARMDQTSAASGVTAPAAPVKFSVDTGDGDDTVEANLGSQDAAFPIMNPVSLHIDQGAGDDALNVNLFVELAGADSALAIDSNAGPGADSTSVALNLSESAGGEVQVQLDGGDGDDTIRLTATGLVSASAAVLGGAGNDTLVLLAPDAGANVTLTVDGGAGFDVCTVSAGVGVNGCEDVQYVAPSEAPAEPIQLPPAESGADSAQPPFAMADEPVFAFDAGMIAALSEPAPTAGAARGGIHGQGAVAGGFGGTDGGQQQPVGATLLPFVADATGDDGADIEGGLPASLPSGTSDRANSAPGFDESLLRLTGAFGLIALQLDQPGLLDEVGLLLEEAPAPPLWSRALTDRRFPDPPNDPLPEELLDAAFEQIGAQRINDESLVHDRLVAQIARASDN